MSGYNRPEGGWRAHFQGIKINAPADSMEPTKSPYSQNIRSYKIQTVGTRPGYSTLYNAVASVTDIGSYSTLQTDNKPRYLARNTSNQIYLDNGVLVGTLAGSSQGAFMIPFRPNQSPQAWMYIGAQADYKKVSAPDFNNNTLFYEVGIEEQQNPPDACPESFAINVFTGVAANWSQGGNVGAPSDGFRLAATNIGAIFPDPASGSDIRYSLEVMDTDSYQVGMEVLIDSGDTNLVCIIQDVLPPINDGSNLVIGSIYYYAGTTGRCVISASQFPSNATAPLITDGIPQASSIYADSVIASLRRGAIVSIVNGEAQTDKCFVLSTTAGPDGSICFEVSTTHTFDAGDVITGIGTIIVTGANGVLANDPIQAADITSSLTGAGTGTLSQSLGSSPFESLLDPTSAIPQQDDYIGIGINISDLSKFVIGKLTFNVGTSVDYATDAFYVQFTANDLIFHPPAATQVTEFVNPDAAASYDGNVQDPPATISVTVPLPSNQWTTLFFPIRTMIRLGNDLTKTLSDCNGVQLSFQSTGNISIAFAGLFVGGGGHPDVGSNAPYFYCAIGRSSVSGAKSNPSPITRYSVSPRRQPVLVTLVDTVLDPQMDTWDIFRFGGTINSWRYIGSTPNSGGGSDTFVDNFFDTSANSGTTLERDNYEPWPTIDVPFNIKAGTVGAITTAIQVTGTTILIIWSSASVFTNPAPATILRWLPGTLVQIGGQTGYTFWNRPVAVTLPSPPAAHYFAYLIQLVENAGSPSPTVLSVLEPDVANQHLPYLWGPDADGTVFGCGDPFRPGSFYSSKSNQPDSAPDSYNQELTSPSEPLLGGDVINGISIIASSSRWWKLYPNFGGSGNRYQPVEMPVGRGLAAPYAHCTDGKSEYFVAKDGIWITSGGAGLSLTDGDLYTLFPHEDINTPQNYTYAGNTLYAPDYAYASEFRLAYINSYLYFDYRDSTGTPRTLVCDLRDPTRPAWAPDVYADPITCHFAPRQQESTLLSTSQRYQLGVLGDNNGKVWQVALNTNDNASSISGVYSTFEYNGGDLRETQLFNDYFLDLVPVSGVNFTPISNGVAQAASTLIGASATRLQTNVPIGQELKFVGAMMTWLDDFTKQSTPTEIDCWQPMYQGVPVSVFQWKTQGTSFGWMAYGHLRQWNFAYRSTAPVTITITVYDGTAPAAITLPSTGGIVSKIMIPFTFNKGMLYFFTGVSSQQWTPYLSESDLYAGEWNRLSPYAMIHDIEAPVGIRS